MKILLLMGSYHLDGTSAALADSFTRGAVEKGHEVKRIECARMNVHPCIGCNNCLLHGVCVWTDDMPAIEKEVKECDAIIYVSPVYYSGITAQLKVVMDRFFSFNKEFLERKPKLGLITSAGEPVYSSSACVVSMFESLCGYVGSENLGTVNAVGAGSLEALKKTEFLQKAYEFGKSI